MRGRRVPETAQQGAWLQTNQRVVTHVAEEGTRAPSA
jgi:hypothetical protein